MRSRIEVAGRELCLLDSATSKRMMRLVEAEGDVRWWNMEDRDVSVMEGEMSPRLRTAVTAVARGDDVAALLDTLGVP